MQLATPPRDSFYPIPQSHSSMVGTDLDSPVDPTSPESHMHSDTHSSTIDSQLNTFGYSASPKSTAPSTTFPNNTSYTSKYTPPFFPIPVASPMSPTYNCLEYTPPHGSQGHACRYETLAYNIL